MTVRTDLPMAMSRANLTKPGIVLACAAVLAGCSPEAPDADRLELATIYPWNEIPKSTPLELIVGFDTFCVNGPEGTAAKETLLRNAGYVPTNTTSGKTRQVFLVDNQLPAIAIGPDMCIARATARSGQTNAVGRYVADTFPSAAPMDTDALTVDVEQAWSIPGGILATARNRWIGNRSSYSVIFFQPQGEGA